MALLLPVNVLAQGGGGFPIDDTYTMISNWTMLASNFLNLMTWFVFSFLIFLMDPRFIFEAGIMDILNEIWQLSRNLMNVVFAVCLIGAAIYTVVTANKEFVSSHLKTFILAVVLVNFSWFIPRVVIDIANVATATIYSIPTAMVAPGSECRYISTNVNGCLEPNPVGENFSCACKAVADFRLMPEPDEIDELENAGNGWECPLAFCVRYIKLDANTSTKHGAVLNGLVVNHARLSQLGIITRVQQNNDIADLLLFILREMVVVVLHIAILFPLAALLVALVIRIPVLWLTMAFMPFYFLSWVVPDEGPFGELKSKAKTIWDMFLKAALLPAAVAIPLSVGFIMANAGSRIQPAGLEGITFNLIDGVGSFGQLLWVIMVMAILWTATFEVLAIMTADMPGAGAINTIRETGSQAGKFAAELPLSTVPIPGVGNALGLSQMLGPRGISTLRAANAREGLEGVKKTLSGNRNPSDQLKAHANQMREPAKTAFKDTANGFNSANANNIEDIKRIFKDHFKDSGVELTNENFKESISKLMEHTGSRRTEIDAFQRQADNYIRARVPQQQPPQAPPPPPQPGAPNI